MTKEMQEIDDLMLDIEILALQKEINYLTASIEVTKWKTRLMQSLSSTPKTCGERGEDGFLPKSNEQMQQKDAPLYPDLSSNLLNLDRFELLEFDINGKLINYKLKGD